MKVRLWKVAKSDSWVRLSYSVDAVLEFGYVTIKVDDIQGGHVELDAGQCALLVAKLDPAHEYRIKDGKYERIPCEVKDSAS